MTIKVLIKRKVTEDTAPGLDFLLRKLRSMVIHQKGYISGETLSSIDEPGTSLVIATWLTLDDWRRWSYSEERRELQDQIDLLVGEPTKFEVYGVA